MRSSSDPLFYSIVLKLLGELPHKLSETHYQAFQPPVVNMLNDRKTGVTVRALSNQPRVRINKQLTFLNYKANQVVSFAFNKAIFLIFEKNRPFNTVGQELWLSEKTNKVVTRKIAQVTKTE